MVRTAALPTGPDPRHPSGRLRPLPEWPELVRHSFTESWAAGLLALGATEPTRAVPEEWAPWRALAGAFAAAACQPGLPSLPGRDGLVPRPDAVRLAALLAPFREVPSLAAVDTAALAAAWQAMDAVLIDLVRHARQPPRDVLVALHPAWARVGRVTLSLVDRPDDPDHPFAFLATVTTGLTAQGEPRHRTLAEALFDLHQDSTVLDRSPLTRPLLAAAVRCEWLAAMIATNEIYHPLQLTMDEAAGILASLDVLAPCGVDVRTPASWKGARRAQTALEATLGDGSPSFLGQAALLDFDIRLTLDDAPLPEDEAEALVASSHGLRLVRGEWVAVDRARLKTLLARVRRLQQTTGHGVTFAHAMHLVAGTGRPLSGGLEDIGGAKVRIGPWLGRTLESLRSPDTTALLETGTGLAQPLFPHQVDGLHWLYTLYRLGLGALLADDMGLGKTLQVLALLVVLKADRERRGVAHRPSLVLAGPSLLANWQDEATLFAPGLRVALLHASALDGRSPQSLSPANVAHADLVLVSADTALNLPWLATVGWDVVALDEAQLIKNPSIRKTRYVKTLPATMRIALTGTPVENRLTDLWSIMDFANPTLLGSLAQFRGWVAELRASGDYGPLRALIRPYLLRRLKTDPTIVASLPGKLEKTVICALTAAQAALYQDAVADLGYELEHTAGMKRRGLILAYLSRFKQICNHVSHWTGDGEWAAEQSGKFRALRRIAKAAMKSGEKLLVFTQYREACGPIAAFLGNVYGRPGLVMNGKVAIGQRRELRRRFQADDSIPFFVISLKTGGAGLNLTAASQVVHFDRWWNPAVENQATDRAHRFGQRRDVTVHKFVTRGTVEERIDELIESKKALVRDVLDDTGSLKLTELSNREVLDLVKLNLPALKKAA